MLALHSNRHAVHGRFTLKDWKDDCERQVWNAVADEWQMNPDVRHVHKRGTWQLCHVRRLAFPLNISFYLMQHTPLWRSKFRILRIKKTRTEIGTVRISHTSLKLLRDIPSGSIKISAVRSLADICFLHVLNLVFSLCFSMKCSVVT